MRCKLTIIIAACLSLGGFVASAQTVQQSGTVTAGHAARWVTNGVIGDGGTAANGLINTLGITNTGTPFCINDAAVGSVGGYHQLCLGANSLGGGLLSYNAYGGASNLPFQVNINGTTTTLGTGTVGAGTLGQLPWYSATGTSIIGNANLNVSNGVLTLGQAGSVIGGLGLSGNTSGVISILPQAAAGTYNFNLPTTAGTVGQVLVSGGGGSSPMTWATFGGTVNSGTIGQTAYYAASGTEVSGTSALTLTATTAALSPSGTVAISPTGALTINPASASTLRSTCLTSRATAGSM